jgi:transcriptional regulator with PAS, ATPase and Fis domain
VHASWGIEEAYTKNESVQCDVNWCEFNIQSVAEGLFILESNVTDLSLLELSNEENTRKIEENEQSLTSVYDTVGDVMFKLAVEPNIQYRFVSVNGEFVHATGLAKEQISGTVVNNIIPEPSLSIVLGKYKKAID